VTPQLAASLQVGSLISYVIALVIPALDAIFPVLPSETVLIALGVATARSTDPRIALLVLCAAVGAFAGDNLSYFIGSRFGPFAERRFFATEKGARRRAWAERSLQRFGVPLIIACRFIPAAGRPSPSVAGSSATRAAGFSPRSQPPPSSGPSTPSFWAGSAARRSRASPGPASWSRSVSRSSSAH
jgi:membrane-associated protein